MRVGDLRTALEEEAAAAGPVTTPAWLITPGIDVTQAYNDYGKSQFSSQNSQNGFSTSIAPSISVSGQTRTIQTNLYYSPQGVIFESGNGKSYVAQNFSGTAHVTLIPETLFVDAQGFAFLQSSTGTASTSANIAPYQAGQVQTYTASIAPYLQHRFGGTGLGEIGYRASYTTSGGPVGNTSTLANALASQQNVFTQSEHAAFTTGEDFGRVNLHGEVVGNQYSGSQLYQGAYTDTALVNAAYAVNRFVTALGMIGYEDIQYEHAIPPVRIKDGIWYVGAKLTPNADSFLTATFGHRYGEENVFVQGMLQPTARLRLFANYSQALATGLQDIQTASDQADVLASGTVIDRTTGSPIVLADNFFGLTNGLSRLNRGSISASLTYDRDVFTASIVSQNNKVIAQAPGTIPQASTRGYYGSLGWSHDLSPDVQTNLSGTYGKQQQSQFLVRQSQQGLQDNYGATASVVYRLSETLTAQAIYNYSRNPAGGLTSSAVQNTALLELSKRF